MIEIDVYSDIVCPWCFIGTRRLEQVVDALAGEPVTIRHRPFVLNPEAPREGIDLHRMLAERYRTDPAQMFARVESVAREAGIPLDLSRQRMTYSTVSAHTLLRHALEKGTQRGLLDALFRAYFLDARNISDPAVLAEAAHDHGFTAEEVERLAADEMEAARTRREVEDAARSGVRGVPLFIFNRKLVLSGAQPPEVLRDAIAKARAA